MKRFFLSTFTIVLSLTTFINAKEIKSVVKINPKTVTPISKIKPEINSIIKIQPEIKYDENIKYEAIDKYSLPQENTSKNKFDFGFDLNVNQEEKTIDYWKVDVKTNF